MLQTVCDTQTVICRAKCYRLYQDIMLRQLILGQACYRISIRQHQGSASHVALVNMKDLQVMWHWVA